MDQSSVPLREFLESRLDMQDRTLEEILEQAKTTNGRVRASEKAIAVLQVGYGVGAFLAAGYVMGWFHK